MDLKALVKQNTLLMQELYQTLSKQQRQLQELQQQQQQQQQQEIVIQATEDWGEEADSGFPLPLCCVTAGPSNRLTVSFQQPNLHQFILKTFYSLAHN